MWTMSFFYKKFDFITLDCIKTKNDIETVFRILVMRTQKLFNVVI